MMSESPDFATILPDSPGFQTRLVAFLDVLGWRNLIVQATEIKWVRDLVFQAVTDVQRTTAKRLRNVLNTGQTVADAIDARVSQFSDSLVLSADPNADSHATFGFLLEVTAICRGYLFYELLVRGGVTVGPMYHKDSVAFGPALTAAYEIESTIARYPRVVLTSDWLKKRDLAPSIDDPDIERFRLLRRDEDGRIFLDYLQPLASPIHSTMPERDTPDLFLRPASRVVRGGLEAFAQQPAVLEKYEWLADYYNTVLSEQQGSTLSPISTRVKSVTDSDQEEESIQH